MPLSRSSRARLNLHTLKHFAGDTLFDRIARTVCRAEALPRKELYEAWETAKRVHRRLRGGPIFELAAGHGLLAHILLLLDKSATHAVCVDRRKPVSFDRLNHVLVAKWPRLEGKVCYLEQRIKDTEIPADALVVSVHACGDLSDQVINAAIGVGARVAVVPCCHALKRNDLGGLGGWMDGALAIDATRATRLKAAGYRIHTHTIPAEITPKNRLLLGWLHDG